MINSGIDVFLCVAFGWGIGVVTFISLMMFTQRLDHARTKREVPCAAEVEAESRLDGDGSVLRAGDEVDVNERDWLAEIEPCAASAEVRNVVSVPRFEAPAAHETDDVVLHEESVSHGRQIGEVH